MARALKTLLVEDDPDDAVLMLKELGRAGIDLDPLCVASKPALAEALTNPWDIILCDHRLPGFNSADVIALERESGIDVPLIIVSGTIGEEAAVEAMRNGASDYVLKSNLKRLVPAVRREVALATERADRRALEARNRLLEAQLLQSQKMEALGRLTGGIAHDFNNLLCAILGFADMLARRMPADEHLQEPLRYIRSASTSAAGLTSQLLAFSRSKLVEPVVLDPNEIVANMERIFRRVIGNDIRVETRLAPRVGHVKADPSQLEQVIMNLAVNARDAMPDGGTLTLATRDAVVAADNADGLAPGRYTVLEVTDSGTGMSAEVCAQIFEPFFTTKPPGEGTGLGLATTYGIVKQAGGHISVESQPGRGTTFRVHLPHTNERLERPAHPEYLAEPRVSADGVVVLIAEDCATVRELVTSALAEHGYSTLSASTGPEALSLGESRDIHLLITGAMMPGMDGGEIAARLLRRRPNLRVLFSSGSADSVVDRLAEIRGGGIGFLPKPFTAEALLSKVRRILGGDPTGEGA